MKVNKICLVLIIIIFCLFLSLCSKSRGKIFKKGYVIAKSGLLLREGPGLKSRPFQKISFTSEVDVIANSEVIEIINNLKGSWLKITYKGKTGYIFSRYIAPQIPFNKKESFIGEYETRDKDKSKRFYPSKISIFDNGKSSMFVNLCSNFGTVFGVWDLYYDNLSGKIILQLQLTNSDFGLSDDDKIQILYKVEKNKFILFKKNPDKEIGCDFFIGDIFYKK